MLISAKNSDSAILKSIGLESVENILGSKIATDNEVDRSVFSTGWYFLFAFALLNLAGFIGLWLHKRAQETGMKISVDGDENDTGMHQDEREAVTTRLLENIRKDDAEEITDMEMEDLMANVNEAQTQNEAAKKELSSRLSNKKEF